MAAPLIFFFLTIISISLGNPSGRIINGKEVPVNEIPYQISIRTPSFDHFCSGSIITSYYVLTAAHCFDSFRKEDLLIIAGTIDLRHGGTKHRVAEIIIHENYDENNSWIHDIALIRSETPFNVKMFGILPEPYENPLVGQRAIVSGWGVTETGEMSSVLKKTEIFIAPQDVCKNVYNKIHLTVHNTQICARHPNQVAGACNADSGGPMIVNDKLVGIVSWSNNCATPQFPTVYTRVSHYMDWIIAHIGLLHYLI